MVALSAMDIRFEMDAERDVAYIRLGTHHPLTRVWKSLRVREVVLDFDPHGDLAGLELLNARKQLAALGVRVP
jgi:uncharacterized protein YuzE